MTSKANVKPKMIKWARIDAGHYETTLPKNIRKNYRKWEMGKYILHGTNYKN